MNYLVIFAHLCAVCCAISAEDVRPASPEPRLPIEDYIKYEEYSPNSFKLVSERVTWQAAFDACKNDGDGAHLMIIDNAKEATLAGLLFARIPSSNKDLLHVGITDRVREGSWVTILNVDVDGELYHVWAKGSPNESLRNNDDCGAINRRVQLTDIPCSSLFNKATYICERELLA